MAGGGKGGGQKQKVGLDPATRRYVEQTLRPAAIDAADFARNFPSPFFNGATPEQLQAAGGLGGLTQDQLPQLFQGAGQAISNLGFAGQTGAQGVGQYFNPFQDEVASRFEDDIARQAQQAGLGVASRTTQAGAFGDRAQQARALAEAEVRRGGLNQLAQLRQGGYSQALGALQADRSRLGSLGMGGLSALGQGLGIGGALYGRQFGIGEGLRGIQNQLSQEPLFRQSQRLGFLGQGIGPYGQVSQTSGGGNLLGSAAGGAIAGSAFGPIGAGIGGGIGLLGGLF